MLRFRSPDCGFHMLRTRHMRPGISPSSTATTTSSILYVSPGAAKLSLISLGATVSRSHQDSVFAVLKPSSPLSMPRRRICLSTKPCISTAQRLDSAI